MKWSWLLALLILAPACGMDVAQVEDIEDLRILAIQANPPEVLLPAAGGFDPAT